MAAKTQKPTQTQKVLISMLKENTGRHMLDSGGAYGRMWERNQMVEFLKTPSATLSFKYKCIDLTKSVFWFLNENLTYDAKMTAKFKRFANRKENEKEPYLNLTGPWLEKLGAKGIYFEGDPVTVNTYNHDSLLSQIILFTYFKLEKHGEEYVLLSIHGGCDARGGYTAPKVFTVNDELGIFDDQKGTIMPEPISDSKQTSFDWTVEDQNIFWDTDDAYTFYPNHSNGKNLNKYDFVTEEQLEEDLTLPEQDREFEGKTKEDFINHPNNGVIFVDSEGNGYCPITGRKLIAY